MSSISRGSTRLHSRGPCRPRSCARAALTGGPGPVHRPLTGGAMSKVEVGLPAWARLSVARAPVACPDRCVARDYTAGLARTGAGADQTVLPETTCSRWVSGQLVSPSAYGLRSSSRFQPGSSSDRQICSSLTSTSWCSPSNPSDRCSLWPSRWSRSIVTTLVTCAGEAVLTVGRARSATIWTSSRTKPPLRAALGDRQMPPA
jgi:hypothetical protein